MTTLNSLANFIFSNKSKYSEMDLNKEITSVFVTISFLANKLKGRNIQSNGNGRTSESIGINKLGFVSIWNVTLEK